MAPPFTAEELERVFARLSEAIDRAGSPEQARLMLARLALLLAGEIGREDRVLALIAEAENTPA